MQQERRLEVIKRKLVTVLYFVTGWKYGLHAQKVGNFLIRIPCFGRFIAFFYWKVWQSVFYKKPKDSWEELGTTYKMRVETVARRANELWEKWFLNEVFPEKITSVLDVGCGYGRLLEILKRERGRLNLVGVDFSSSQLKTAKKYLKDDRIRLLEVDVTKGLPFKDRSFELVTTNGCLQHIYRKDIDFVLSELLRVSRRYVITVESERIGPRVFGHDIRELLMKKGVESQKRKIPDVLVKYDNGTGITGEVQYVTVVDKIE